MRKNMYLIAGGRGSDSTEFVRRALAETGKKDPTVAYIGTANGENTIFMENFFAPLLHDAGVGRVELVHLLGTKQASPEVRDTLLRSDLVFLSGGEVEDGIRGIPGDVRVLLRQLYDMGKVFLSVSAGTIMLGIGWPHWDDEDNRPEDAVLFDCLGFAPTIFDTHCEGEDWVELRKAVALSAEGFVGYGIPSGVCVVVAPDGGLHPTAALDAFRCENGKAVYIGKYEG